MEITEPNNDTLKALFFNTIDSKDINTVFQPIVSLRDGSVFGYEALSRGPQGTSMESPQMLFEYAEKNNMLWELEFLCRLKALEAVNRMQIDIKLFLNVNPNIIHDLKFKQGFTKEYLNKFNIDPESVVFEITEKEAINNITDFKKTVENYKNQYYKIAIDDAGAGFSGLNLISDIHPHFIKLDINLIRDIDKDVIKQSLIKGMCEFAFLTNTLLIAEGIETEKELLKLIEVGVHYGQGYLIQRPLAAIKPIKSSLVKLINDENVRKNHVFGYRVADVYINNICKPLRTISPNILVSQTYEMFKNDPTLPGFCVVEDNNLKGIITRNELLKNISGLYGYSLFSKKPIKTIMSKEFLHVDYRTPIDIVSKLAMQREFDKLYDFIVVTKKDHYLGIVTIKELLEKTIQIEVTNARHLNPLTGLPGNLLVEKQLEKCIHSQKNSYILYFDLNNFKSYNDVYGFENGDNILKCTSEIIKNYIPKDEFIGHIGGDDFVAVVSAESVNQLCDNIIKEFDQSVFRFYSQDDIKKGFIVSKNRQGIEESFPLLSISIAGVSSSEYEDIYNLTLDVARVKKICKQKVGSNYIRM